MSHSLITIFVGPTWRALAIQALLEQLGFTVFVPEQNLRTLDPTLWGGDAFSLAVQVPDDAAQVAKELVEQAGI
jgi:hypothetical protein